MEKQEEDKEEEESDLEIIAESEEEEPVPQKEEFEFRDFVQPIEQRSPSLQPIASIPIGVGNLEQEFSSSPQSSEKNDEEDDLFKYSDSVEDTEEPKYTQASTVAGDVHREEISQLGRGDQKMVEAGFIHAQKKRGNGNGTREKYSSPKQRDIHTLGRQEEEKADIKYKPLN